MYNACFGFDEQPFTSVPRVDHYFPGTAIEAARATLARCIQRSEGSGMVVGPSGTGKTLLCQMLAGQFRDSFDVALLLSGRLSTRRALLQAILYELGRPYRTMDEGELRLALVDHLTQNEDCPQGMLLLVDEAHTLPLRLLEEIRMLTNLARNGQPRVRLVLSGGCLLEERFASPKLDSFSQRLVARCYLEAFNQSDTQAYIHARIDAAGGRGERTFSADTCRSVYQATGGIPRLINQVCDHALMLAYVGGRQELEPAHIEEAWADLQQLPTPWNGEEQSEGTGGGVIEFGGLDDQPAESGTPAHDEFSAPSLRISPDTEGVEPEAPEPSEQLARIEQTLADVDEDFQPAGSIGPEVELVFPDPFKEKFEQEEVVADRYTPPGEAAGEETSQSSGAQTGPAPAAGVETDDREQEPAPGSGFGDDDRRLDADAGSDDEPAAFAEPDEPVSVAGDAEPETVPLPRRQPVAAEPDEEDTIIVEDEYDEDDAAVTCPIVAVRRHEFGQLFAKLRRG